MCDNTSSFSADEIFEREADDVDCEENDERVIFVGEEGVSHDQYHYR